MNNNFYYSSKLKFSEIELIDHVQLMKYSYMPYGFAFF